MQVFPKKKLYDILGMGKGLIVKLSREMRIFETAKGQMDPNGTLDSVWLDPPHRPETCFPCLYFSGVGSDE